MKNAMVSILWCVFFFGPLGCASQQRRFTGFLDDYSNLTPHPSIPNALVYWNPDIDRTQYEAVLVEPVEVDFLRRSEENGAKPEDVAAFRRFVTNELISAISKHAAIATEPGANVLRLRLQIANLQLTRPTGPPRYPWLPSDYALGSASIETEARDSISGELVVGYVSPPGGVEIYTPFPLTSAPDSWEPAKAIIRHRIVAWTDHAARYFVPELKQIQTAATSPIEGQPTSAIRDRQATR